MTEQARNDETTKKTTGPKRAARAAGNTARRGAASAAAAAEDAKSTAAETSEEVTGRVVALSTKAKAGGAFLSSVPGKSVQAATTAWTLVKNRKAVAACAGGGAIAALLGAFSLGRAGARRGQGPLTRATGGRF
ncbi:hypothetical protein [Streptomyces sp. 142MFCol3.1]|uniref:hypothetical protein n=1 Tax=Streptomyces sp. 142MFCol3.1 TaxID=1172179 RepID=UPI001319FA71|nr:hypothetical protein [Streptomyces sp. 142MFCol3.1]